MQNPDTRHCQNVVEERLTICHHLNFNVLRSLSFFYSQIFVISQAEPRLPLQLDDAVRAEGEGEEVSVGEGEESCGPLVHRAAAGLFQKLPVFV